MCGIVAATLNEPVMDVLLEGLQKLEYRGYDSAGLSIASKDAFRTIKEIGKVRKLDAKARKERDKLTGTSGVAHTRWATHGSVTLRNAHPHTSGSDIVLVHNGIIENHNTLRLELEQAGYRFVTDTDTEVIAHMLAQRCSEGASLLDAFKKVQARLRGSYALAAMHRNEPGTIVAARMDSPLIVACAAEGYLLASDIMAIRDEVHDFIYPEEGDIICLKADSAEIYDKKLKRVSRPTVNIEHDFKSVELGSFKHYMQKEIWEQPKVIAGLMEHLISGGKVNIKDLSPQQLKQLDQAQAVHLVACGTSYHSALAARYWIEALADVPCSVDIASEYRYRGASVPPNTLLIVISQSGETADTLAALRGATSPNYLGRWNVCNVERSSLTREADCTLFTRAGVEIGVASTKAFTTQMVMLLSLAVLMANRRKVNAAEAKKICAALAELPALMDQALALDSVITKMASDFKRAKGALFLGRGMQYPAAMEGALKLKEISYIHAEAYAAGELKHGPLALVDKKMAVVALVPTGELSDKMISNLEEVHARDGRIYAFIEQGTTLPKQLKAKTVTLPAVHPSVSPVLYALPLQMLAYHVAVILGADVDQPRNLAKSVTVE